MNPFPALLLALAASAAAAAPGPGVEVKASLKPKKAHEECMRLEAGESRRYHWKSSAPVDFNIHYHRGEEVLYPVKRTAMRGDGGSFTAAGGEDYCWMWSARDKAATIEGRIGN